MLACRLPPSAHRGNCLTDDERFPSTAVPELPVVALIMTISFAILWIVGEVSDSRWLRRVAGPLFVVAVAGIAVVATAIHTSFSDSIRYSGAMKRFVSAVIETSERDGDAAAVEQLKRFDDVSIETYEGGALLKWLAEPTAETQDGE